MLGERHGLRLSGGCAAVGGWHESVVVGTHRPGHLARGRDSGSAVDGPGVVAALAGPAGAGPGGETRPAAESQRGAAGGLVPAGTGAEAPGAAGQPGFQRRGMTKARNTPAAAPGRNGAAWSRGETRWAPAQRSCAGAGPMAIDMRV